MCTSSRSVHWYLELAQSFINCNDDRSAVVALTVVAAKAAAAYEGASSFYLGSATKVLEEILSQVIGTDGLGCVCNGAWEDCGSELHVVFCGNIW